MIRLSQLVRRSSHHLSTSGSLSSLFVSSPLLRPNNETAPSFTLNSSPRFHASQAKKPKKKQNVSGTEGRIVLQQHGSLKKTKSSKPRMCVGCGTEVVAQGRGGATRMAAGADALNPEQSKTKTKKSRYVDTMDPAASSGFLCERCRALKGDNIWKAYDALRDVSPEIFAKQVKHIVSRRKFGFCVMVVDATDPEHTAVQRLRNTIGSTPTILVVNKIDLVPRMSDVDLRYLRARIQKKGAQFIDCYAVSAETGAGLVELAEGILNRLGGRDVFVVGSANVGKSSVVKRLSTLIADSVHLKGTGRSAAKRREAAANLKVTGSNLPGTTLQAVRVPCFPSRGHALWDTPGIINPRALQYHVFPAHLMEPLTRPGAMEIPTRENGLINTLRPGQSILVEATWMNENDNDEETCVLARVDLVGARSPVHTEAYLHPSLRVRVVPTSKAPDKATIPSSHIEEVKKRIQKATGHHETGLENEYSLPLAAFCDKTRPDGEFIPGSDEYRSGKYKMDILFPSLGWIFFLEEREYVVIPRCVEGSVFSKRRAIYPVNLYKWLDESESTEHSADEIDDDAMRNLRDAARRGRHVSNAGKSKPVTRRDYDEDEWY